MPRCCACNASPCAPDCSGTRSIHVPARSPCLPATHTRSAPGGIVDYATKKPIDGPLLDLTVGYRDGGVYRAHLDNGRRFGGDGRFGHRFNLLREQGGSCNDTRLERTLASLALDARLPDDLTWTADLLCQDRQLENNGASTRRGCGR